jgi:hypothetical protein
VVPARFFSFKGSCFFIASVIRHCKADPFGIEREV